MARCILCVLGFDFFALGEDKNEWRRMLYSWRHVASRVKLGAHTALRHETSTFEIVFRSWSINISSFFFGFLDRIPYKKNKKKFVHFYLSVFSTSHLVPLLSCTAHAATDRHGS